MNKLSLTRVYLSVAVFLTLALAVTPGVASAAFGVSPENFAFGLSSTQEGTAPGQAGAHPDMHVNFKLNTLPEPEAVAPLPDGTLRDFELQLPPGVVANPTVAPACTMGKLNDLANPCPPQAAVGQIDYAAAVTGNSNTLGYTGISRIFRVKANPGEAAAFGAWLKLFPVRFAATVSPQGGYRITVTGENLTEAQPLRFSNVTMWGNPSEHQGPGAITDQSGGTFGGPLTPRPTVPSAFVTAPSSCEGSPLSASLVVTSWQTGVPNPPVLAESPAIEGCENLEFAPTASVSSENHRAGAPTGLDVHLNVPQSDDTRLLATPNVKDVSVTLSGGVAVNPSSAAGLVGCSRGQIGFTALSPQAVAEFDSAAPACPQASKIGEVEIKTPLLDEELHGAVYLAQQNANPFGSLLALYIVAEGNGVLLKLAGKVEADPVTGRLTASFDGNPQLPFSALTVKLKSGPRAPLLNPPACGSYAVKTEITSWAGQQASSESSLVIDEGPEGGACPTGALAPQMSAGLQNPISGLTSPFTMSLRRPDASRPFSAVDLTLPKGLVAYLKGVPYCPDGALAAVSGQEGTGMAQVASPSCLAASQIGSASIGVGGGSNPLYVDTGKVYLAGPYKGAPLSLAIVTPAVAGPFDLGSVVVRSALFVDPVTTQITAKSDPIPTILYGIPLDIRDIRLAIDRPSFTLAPTNCTEMTVAAEVHGEAGARASVSNRFQVANCERLGFAPKLSLRLKGPTKRGKYPKLRAELKAKPGEANIGRVSVALPHSEFLAQEHIKTICTRVQFAADACPAGSIYGYAKAWTPLLDQPLQGPVYLRSSSNPLPDMVAALHGQIDVDLSGRIDSVNGGIRTTFESVPDAAVSRFVLEMKGGKKSLLVNSRDLCRSTNRATVLFEGQNGKSAEQSPALANGCGEKVKRRAHHNG